MRHPTMIFSPVQLKRFRPLRGTIFQGKKLSKSTECRLLESHGIPVPKWTLMSQNYQPDLTDHASYVVVKPDVGGRGADVKIKRKGRVRWIPPVTEFARRAEQWMVQQMVYTGPWPTSYRVTTLFGEVLWSLKIEADHRRQPMVGPHYKNTAASTLSPNLMASVKQPVSSRKKPEDMPIKKYSCQILS